MGGAAVGVGVAEEKRTLGDRHYCLALARACVALSKTRMVGQNNAGCACHQLGLLVPKIRPASPQNTMNKRPKIIIGSMLTS